MEKVLEVYNNIKDRLSNPFVFSFICSWLVYNWRIPVALFWFDEKQISANGCSSIFEFIQDDWKRNGSIGWPLVFAFVYSFGIPYVKNFFRVVSARAQKWGENGEIKALDGGKIGVEKYLELRDNFIEKIKKLEDVAKEEKKYLDENGELLIELNTLKSDLNNSIREREHLNEKIKDIFDISILNGNWNFKYNKSDTETVSKKVSISYGSYKILDERGFLEEEFVLIHFHKKDNYIFFVKKLKNPGRPISHSELYRYSNLRIENNNLLNGEENEYFHVSYEKQSDVNYEIY